ncbi:MAG: long-chain fatty acid--CoA ligase [Cytophagaceae bacterium]|nr:long-chain fatty acid--CoA ligase [Cytophagaceae bacterium]
MESPQIAPLTAPKTARYERLYDLLPNYVAKYNKSDVFAQKINGQWKTYSAEESIRLIDQVSMGLMKLGIGKNDKVAIISPNRPEWNFVEFGIQQIGAVSVPMYPTITVDDYRYIFNDAGVKVVFVGSEEIYQKVEKARPNVPSLQAVYTFDETAGAKSWTEVLKLGETGDRVALEAAKNQVEGEDLLTLIYTSGTTGVPKGVMLTHNNILSNVEAVIGYIPIDETARALSFLPLCHIYERTVIYVYLRRGISVYYAESMETIADNLREVKPQVFTTVPRLLEKVYDKIVSKGHELTGLKKSLFFWALNLGLRYDPMKPMGWWYDQQLALARKLIFSKWQAALGGNVKIICSGSAALQPRLSRVFWAAGIAVSEGYGLTETSPVVSTSMVEPKDFRIGCVGTVIPGVEVKIAEDGEILVKGPNVMKGYYNKPEQTAEVIDAGGWFHTGDIGTFEDGKYLKITDRKKEIFKTSGGKYVAPQVVENKLKESMYIEQVVVVGEGQKFPSALIVPEYGALKTWCNLHEIACDTNQQMVDNEKVIEKINQEVEKLNEAFAQYEKVKKNSLLAQPFTIDGGELTPTLKLKRKNISTKYKNLIDKMYA